MRPSFRPLWLFILAVTLAWPALAAKLETTLDSDEVRVAMGASKVIQATLRNSESVPVYLTGMKVQLSDGASGNIYNPALLHERLFKLDPGQSWDGPLVLVKPSHRGPLWVKGTIYLTGGSTPNSTDPLASIPIRLTIDDPRREADGSYDREAAPSCDRSVDDCCDPSEINCYQAKDRCLYVAEGYDRQEVCINHQPEKTYEYIADLKVSSDGAHMAYLASFQCSSSSADILCKRTAVIDHAERPGPEVATHLDLSPDGLHYAYLARQACVFHLGEESCSGSSRPIVDGFPVKVLPAWYHNKE